MKSNEISTCDVCNKVFSNKRNMVRHIKMVHKKIKASQCDQCQKTGAPQPRRLGSLGLSPGTFSDLLYGSFFQIAQKCNKKSPKKIVPPLAPAHFRRLRGPCQKRFYNSTLLKIHVDFVHKKIKKFQCKMCKKRFSMNTTLIQHVQSIHEKIKHKCNFCKEEFSQRGNVSRHMKLVHGKVNIEIKKPDHDSYSCNSCDKTFSTKKRLKSHKDECKPKNHHQCDKCNKHFNLRANLERHKRDVHDKIRNFKCNQCEKSFAQLHTLKGHVQSMHEGLKYECELCGKAFPHRSNMIRHVRLVHENKGILKPKNHQCGKCERTFYSKEKLLLHQEIRHNVTNFQCKICDKIFSLKATLKSHTLSVHDKVKIKCDFCPDVFSQRANMLRHIKIVHKKEKVQCLKCEKSFCDKSTMKLHVQSVHNVSKSKCDLCEEIFDLKPYMIKHMKIVHKNEIFGNEKGYKCDHCEKSFVSWKTFKRHMVLIHEKSRDFKCEKCEKTFLWKPNLVRHIEIVHEKVKNHQCSQCNKQFSLIQSLESHVKAVHLKIKDEQCNLCKKTFSNVGNLRRHCRLVHKISRKMWKDKSSELRGKVKFEVHKNSSNHSTEINNVKNEEKEVEIPKEPAIRQNPEFYQCNICDTSFSFKENYIEHMQGLHKKSKILDEELKSSIITVKEEFRTNNVAPLQAKTFFKSPKSPKKEFLCNKCNKGFTRRYNLTIHQKSAHEKCSNKTIFVEDNDLVENEHKFENKIDENVLKEGNEPRNKANSSSKMCDICFKTFSKRSNMTNHRDTVHFKLKIHHCDFCDKSFTQKAHLAKHKSHLHGSNSI